MDACVDGCTEQPGYASVIEAFSEIAEAISDDVELDTLLHMVARKVCDLLGIRRCSVYLKDPETGLYRGRVGETGLDQDREIQRLTCGVEADGFTREILERKVPVYIPNAQSDPRPVRSTMRAWNVRSMLGVPMTLRGNVIGLLFLDNEDVPHDFTPQEQDLSATFANLAAIAISQATRAAELRESMKTVARQNEVLRLAAAIEDRLTSLAIEGVSLSGIADAIAQLTGRPCAIHDAEYRRLAAGRPKDRDASLPQLFDPELRHLPAVAEAIEGLRLDRPSIVAAMPSAGIHRRTLVAPLLVRDEHWGYLVISEYGSSFRALDVAVARRSAMIIALELSAERRSAEGGGDHGRDTVIRGLLSGSEDERGLARRAEFHGLDIGAPHVVCLLAGRDPDAAMPTPEAVEAAVSAAPGHPRVWATGMEDGSVATILELASGLPPRTAVARAKEAVAAAVGKIAPAGGVLVAMSSACATAAEYRRGYDEARQVARCLAALAADADDVAVLTADDLGAGRLLLSLSDRAESDRFVRDVLGPLIDHPDPRVDDVLVTLNVFFECSRSVREAAQRLDVHENTIRYRLSRASSLTGLDLLADANDQLAAQIALLILKLERRLPPASRGAEEVAVAG